MTAANRLLLSRQRETTFGEAPGVADMEKCFVTSESLKIAKQFERSETITGDRVVDEHIPVGIAVEGGANLEFAYGYIDWVLESGALGLFTPAVEAYNATADSEIAGISNVNDEFTAAGTWAEGMLVRSVLQASAPNNGRFRAIAGSGAGTLKIGAGGTLVDDAAPPAGARLTVVGFEGEAGDLSITVDGLASVALDFTTLGLVPDQQVKIGPTGVGADPNKMFQNIAVDTYLTIDTIEQNLIRFKDKPAAWVPVAGGGRTIQVFVGDFLTIGDTVITDTFEKTFGGQGANQKFLRIHGVGINTLTLNLQKKRPATGNCTVIGATGKVENASLGATPTIPLRSGVMNTANNIARIIEGDADIAKVNACQRMSWALNNNYQPIDALGSESACALLPGDADLTVNADWLFGSWDIYEKYMNGTDSSLMFPIFRNGFAFCFRSARMTYTDGDIPTEGRNGSVEAKMVGSGKKDPITGAMFTVTRFRETN